MTEATTSAIGRRPYGFRLGPLPMVSRSEAAGLFFNACGAALLFIDPVAAGILFALYPALCLAGAFFPSWNFFLPVLSRGDGKSGEVALTFDDGPDPVSTPHLLNLLDRHQVKAAFFVVGEKAEANPSLVREIIARGHEIGNHSQDHDFFLMLRSEEELLRNLTRCREVLLRHGVRPLAFRPPLVITNSRLPKVLRRLGMFCAGYACRPRDFGNMRVRGLAKRLVGSAAPGDVVLLHDCSPRGDLGEWLKEVDAALTGLKARGMEFRPLSVVLDRKVMEWVPSQP